MATKTKTKVDAEPKIVEELTGSAAKLAAVDSIMATLNAQKLAKNADDKRPAIYRAGERPDLLDHGVLKSGNLALDTQILHGGYKRGSCTMIYGLESSGKTSLALESIANIQREYDGVCALIHSELVFPVEHARILGVDLSKLIIIQDFTNGEAAFDLLRKLLVDEKFVPRNIIDFVVVDSIAAMASQSELQKLQDDGLAADTMCCHPKMITKMTKLIFNTGAVGKAAVLLINQLRDIVSYGGGTYFPGGRALRHCNHVAVKITAPKNEDNILTEGTGKDKKVVGHTVYLETTKNKAGLGGHPGEKASYTVRYNVGTQNEQPLFDAACVMGLIEEPSKAYYTFNLPKEFLSHFGLWKTEINKKGEVKVDAPLKMQGAKNVLSVLRTTPPLFNALLWHIRDDMDLDAAMKKAMDERVVKTDVIGSALSEDLSKVAEEVQSKADAYAEDPSTALAETEDELSVFADEE